MPWLIRDGRVLASLEIAATHRERAHGLVGRDGIEGALLLQSVRSVHTFGMRFPIDVAFCDAEMRVLRVVRMRPHRVSRPVRHADCVIEAEAGAFERWQLRSGDQLEIKG